MTKYIIRFDDFFVGMEKESLSRITKTIIEYSIPAIIGVVPAWEDELSVNHPVSEDKFWQTIQQLQKHGCEIALHGYSHKLFKCKNLLNVNNYGEFSGLPIKEQEQRIKKGLEILKYHNIHCRMFMAPAHSFDLNTLKVLEESEISLITDGKSLYPYCWKGLIFLPQISSKFNHYPWGIITICLHPQWMNNDTYSELIEFCKNQGANIVDVQYSVDYINKMGVIQRTVDAIVRQLYFLLKRFR